MTSSLIQLYQPVGVKIPQLIKMCRNFFVEQWACQRYFYRG